MAHSRIPNFLEIQLETERRRVARALEREKDRKQLLSEQLRSAAYGAYETTRREHSDVLPKERKDLPEAISNMEPNCSEENVILKVYVKAEAPEGILTHDQFCKKIQDYMRLADMQCNRNLIDKALEANQTALKFCKDKDENMKDELEKQRARLIEQKLKQSIERIEKAKPRLPPVGASLDETKNRQAVNNTTSATLVQTENSNTQNQQTKTLGQGKTTSSTTPVALSNDSEQNLLSYTFSAIGSQNVKTNIVEDIDEVCDCCLVATKNISCGNGIGTGVDTNSEASGEQTGGGGGTGKRTVRRTKQQLSESFEQKLKECIDEELKADGSAGGIYGVPTLMIGRTKTIQPLEAKPVLSKASDIHKTRVTSIAPFRPRGGEVYLFNAGENPEQANDYKADGYRWKSSGGGMPLPKSDPVVKRFYECLVTPTHPGGNNEFTRTCYRLVRKTGNKKPNGNDEIEEVTQWTLVHYIGNESLYQKMSHGNELPGSTTEFIRSAPSLLAELKQSCPTAPKKVYASLLATKNVPPPRKPRDKKQVKNHQHLYRDSLRLTHDELANVIEFGLQVKDFVRSVNIDIDNESVGIYLVSKDLCRRISQVLSLPKIPDRPVQLQYDTAFRVGEFYLSTLSFRHPSFNNYPAIPFAFLISTRKYAKDHFKLFEYVKESCPALGRKSFVMVTDREFRNIASVFPHVQHLYCWKHIGTDVETWVRQHKSQDTREPKWYAGEVKSLMHCEDATIFETELAKKKQKWAKAFVDYFEVHIKPDILVHANRWKLEELGVYTGGTDGITTNAAEGVNTMIKSINNFEIMLMDTCAMSLHFLCKLYVALEEYGRAGQGTWRGQLCNEHRHYAMEIDQIFDDEDFRTPEDIAKFIIERAKEARKDKGGHNDEREEAGEEKDGGSDDDEQLQTHTNMVEEEVADLSANADDLANPKAFLPSGNAPAFREKTSKVVNSKPSSNNQLGQSYDTQRTMALRLIAEQRINPVPNPRNDGKQLFMAIGSTNQYYAIALELEGKKWKETCGCVARRTCYHIIAARFLAGIPVAERTGRPMNLTSLVKNSRAPKERCRGGKIPRRNDYVEVNPAPDSFLGDSTRFPPSSTPTKRFKGSASANQKRPPTISEVDEEPNVNEERSYAAPPRMVHPVKRLSRSFDLDDQSAKNKRPKVSPDGADRKTHAEEKDFYDKFDADRATSPIQTSRTVEKTGRLDFSDLEDPIVKTSKESTTPATRGSKNTKNCAAKKKEQYDDDDETEATEQRHNKSDIEPKRISRIQGENRTARLEKGEGEHLGKETKRREKKEKDCYCQTTRPKNIDYVQCDFCSKWYHTTCASIPEEAINTEEEWSCPMCTLPSFPSQGGNLERFELRNTCPIDTVLSLFYLYFVENPSSLSFLGQRPEEVVLKNCMEDFMQHRFLDGKGKWVDFLLASKTLLKELSRASAMDTKYSVDLHGGEMERVYRFFRHVFHMKSISSCDADDCPEPVVDRDFWLPILNNGMEVQTLFEPSSSAGACNLRLNTTKDQLEDARSGSSLPRRCMGNRNYLNREFTAETPWFLPIECTTCTFATMSALAQDIELQGRRYHLGGYTIHDSERDHFTLVFLWRGRYFHFDGMRRKAIPLEREYSKLTRKNKNGTAVCTPNNAVYFLCKK